MTLFSFKLKQAAPTAKFIHSQRLVAANAAPPCGSKLSARTGSICVNRTKMFTHFGTIDGLRKRTSARRGGLEAGIWSKREIAIRFML
ncbi:MAG: hypothetical protein DLM68_12365 [Hyphomicrobiales bacterium]|nr:MAG: hypothetical protein DLM68_12365 [Hyphomicrobiales bacterium]